MPAAQTRVPTYVSPAAWAREIEARLRAGAPVLVSKKTLHTARRIHRLATSITLDLEAVEAPLHVFRWVAWAPKNAITKSNITKLRQRADLVLHLRRTFERQEGGWFLEREHAAAFDVWMRAIEEARKQGRLHPRAGDVPLERYAEAIVAVSSQRRRRAPAASLANEAELRALARRIAQQLNLGPA
jgi:hypothetical protein